MSVTITVQSPSECSLQARRVILRGHVQGLGVRPAIFRLATRIGVNGIVRNSARGVEIDVEGTAEQLSQFSDQLEKEFLRGTGAQCLESESIEPQGHSRFSIEQSTDSQDLSTPIPADLGVCVDCLRECEDPEDRRHRYPLTSCTHCGPRYTVIREMPYERADTTMSHFAFCSNCRSEYESPDDHRFHAQTISCPHCGPQVWCVDEGGQVVARADEAIRLAVRTLLNGEIIALRGVGGYQLLVDATNERAVRRLRDRKSRRAKPLAIMVDSLQSVEQLARLDDAERDVLSDVCNPIVLLRAKTNSSLSSDTIHPGLDIVGMMLPTTPLHTLVARGVDRPLVCTSGNVEGEPLEFEINEAQRKLKGVCDLWLHHDRPIARPIDDSVVRVIAGRRVTLRLARGLAPLALDLSLNEPTIALGGHLKSAAAWSNGFQAVLGPHVGDHGTLASRERFLNQCDDWQRLYRFQPNHLIHDMHPTYFTSSWAMQQNISTQSVQHHHAHIVAGMLEHGWLDRKVLGVAWDGTGYGTDGTIWGGEFLIATAKSFERVASQRPFRLPGGEAAIREPWRIAVALATTVGRESNPSLSRHYFERLQSWSSLSRSSIETIQQIAKSPNLSTEITSAGRLFDAAATIALGVTHAEFDGQPAMMLEAVADHAAPGIYDFPVRRRKIQELDWQPLFEGLLTDVMMQIEPAAMAMKFHRSVAAAIVSVCRQFPEFPVVLGGGVFQNRLLTELILEMIDTGNRELGLPGIIPPNDGGLAAGQLAAAGSGCRLEAGD